MGLSKWNLFTKKIFKEGKAKNSNYTFQQALKDASKRKGEMGSMKNESKMMTKKRGRKSRRHRKSRKH